MPSLTGTPQIVCTQAGKNVIDISGTDTDNGYISGSWISSSNSPNTNADWYTTEYLPILPSVEYALSGIAYGNSPAFCFYDETKTFISGIAYSNRTTITFTSPNNAKFARFSIRNDFTAFMLEVGATASTYEPYTTPTTYTAQLGRTIYGGSVDVVNGTGTDGAQKIKIGDLDWTYQSANTRFYTASLTSTIAKPSTNGELAPFLYSDVLSPLSFTAAQNIDKSICVATSGNIFVKDTTYTDKDTFLQNYGDTYIIVGKAMPENFTFTPITPTPETALGVNNFWADEGDSDVTYRADIDLLLGGN